MPHEAPCTNPKQLARNLVSTLMPCLTPAEALVGPAWPGRDLPGGRRDNGRLLHEDGRAMAGGSRSSEVHQKSIRAAKGSSARTEVHEHFAILIPKSYPLASAGPVMCAGVTMSAGQNRGVLLSAGPVQAVCLGSFCCLPRYEPLRFWKAGQSSKAAWTGEKLLHLRLYASFDVQET